MTTIKCRDHTFELSAKQEAFLSHARAGSMPVAYVDCPRCKRSVKVELGPKELALEAPLARCPVARCTGWVVDISDKLVDKKTNRWGCGECSNTWVDDKTLFAAIDSIVGKYPHRAAVYVRNGGSWSGVTLSAEPRDYVAHVEGEEN